MTFGLVAPVSLTPPGHGPPPEEDELVLDEPSPPPEHADNAAIAKPESTIMAQAKR
jgi:hypothetical protein